MRRLVCRAFGTDDAVAIETAGDPTPAANEVVVRVTAANVTFVDRLIVGGRYQIKPPLPFTPGAVGAGEVVAVGPGVHGVRPGQRVVALKPQYGMWASHAAVPETGVAVIPDEVSDAVAAAAIEAYGTARFALEDRGRLAEGERVLIHGATGAVGSAAIEVAVHLGAEVVAVSKGPAHWPDRHARPAAVIDLDEIGDLRDDLRSRYRDGFDVVLDPVGGAMAEPSLRSLRLSGRYLVVGFASGQIPEVPTNLALLRNRSIVGVEWASWIVAYPDQMRAGMEIVLERLARGAHHLPAPAVTPLDELPEVLRSPAPSTGLIRTVVAPT